MQLLRPRHRGMAIVLLLWTTFPILCMIGASTVASAGGCTVDEGAVHPCRVFGVDIGALLYTLGGMGWLGLVTLPRMVEILCRVTRPRDNSS